MKGENSGRSSQHRQRQNLDFSYPSPYTVNSFFKLSDRDLSIWFISYAHLRLFRSCIQSFLDLVVSSVYGG